MNFLGITEETGMNTQRERLVARQELPAIATIINDETWLEAERRGCYVSSEDPAVVDNVCGVVLRIGDKLRQDVLRRAS